MSDLDKEELEATRKLQSSAVSAEKTADEMFDALGYKIDENEERIVIYNTNRSECKLYKVVFYPNATEDKFRLKVYEQYLNIEFLKAINKKCQESGWLDE